MNSVNMTEWLAVMFPLICSPGPANVVATISGAQVGLRRSIPLFLGINTIYVIYGPIMGIGVGEVLVEVPLLFPIMKYGGGAFVIWLGVDMWRRAKDRTKTVQLGFREGIFIQALNPKFLIVLVAMFSSFLVPTEPLMTQVITLSFSLLALNIFSQVSWAGAGIILGRTFTNERAATRQDRAFGFLLMLVGLWIAFR